MCERWPNVHIRFFSFLLRETIRCKFLGGRVVSWPNIWVGWARSYLVSDERPVLSCLIIWRSCDEVKLLKPNCLSSASSSFFHIFDSTSAVSQGHPLFWVGIFLIGLCIFDFCRYLFCGPYVILGAPARKTIFLFCILLS